MINRRTLPIGSVVLIVILSVFFLLGLAVWLRRRHRRFRQRSFEHIQAPFETPPGRAPPRADSDTQPDGINNPNSETVRRLSASTIQDLEAELAVAREKMADMEDSEAGSVSESGSHVPSRASSLHLLPQRVLRLFLASSRPGSMSGSSSDGGPSDAERPPPSELEKRNEALTARIAELEEQIQSGWAPEEPLPRYMA